ncbi:hypothetical protein SmJEL517_g02694 [Synchytrium microbalum]|uniref:Glycosyltransferase family 92 protein n=1 Tax=Synchytrium microbalum TaxID=1806994 RepID=A0A507C4V7_9FUNG|nr:uncharacterized protein SmJEL517_g02694 [Synchytrium microbalum]TPX34712.1 hypothetical protein SmJEL517_g02694 [Synchytrium microbalum]
MPVDFLVLQIWGSFMTARRKWTLLPLLQLVFFVSWALMTVMLYHSLTTGTAHPSPQRQRVQRNIPLESNPVPRSLNLTMYNYVPTSHMKDAKMLWYDILFRQDDSRIFIIGPGHAEKVLLKSSRFYIDGEVADAVWLADTAHVFVVQLKIDIDPLVQRVRLDAPGAGVTTWVSRQPNKVPDAKLGAQLVFANDSDTMALNIAYHHHLGFNTFYLYDNSIQHPYPQTPTPTKTHRQCVTTRMSLTTSTRTSTDQALIPLSASPQTTFHSLDCIEDTTPSPLQSFNTSLVKPLSPYGVSPYLNTTTVQRLLDSLLALIKDPERPLYLIFADWPFMYFGDSNINSGQVTAQNHVLYLSSHHINWMMLIDHDEFLVPRISSQKSAESFFDTVDEKYVAVSVQSVWFAHACYETNVTFGSTDYIEKLLWRNNNALGPHYREKTIVRPHLVKQFRTHFVEIGTADVLLVDPSEIWFHHYRPLTAWTKQRASECMSHQTDTYDPRILELWIQNYTFKPAASPPALPSPVPSTVLSEPTELPEGVNPIVLPDGTVVVPDGIEPLPRVTGSLGDHISPPTLRRPAIRKHTESVIRPRRTKTFRIPSPTRLVRQPSQTPSRFHPILANMQNSHIPLKPSAANINYNRKEFDTLGAGSESQLVIGRVLSSVDNSFEANQGDSTTSSVIWTSTEVIPAAASAIPPPTSPVISGVVPTAVVVSAISSLISSQSFSPVNPTSLPTLHSTNSPTVERTPNASP